MTNRQIRCIAFMLFGIYMRIFLPLAGAPAWVNLALGISAWAAFWFGFYTIMKTVER